MTTERIYYTDSYRTAFEATVIGCEPAGDRFKIALDRTAFYPTSGGQPHDVGQLGDAQVLDVIDEENGRIAHVTDAPLDAGSRAAGAIDWRRRFDHMQQHTGQHLLSAAFDRLFGIRTESFHLGGATSTIDLAREVSPVQIADADGEANRVVWEDRPVTMRIVSGDEAAALPLRKESVRTGPLRLIEVEDFDLSACGGTHVARTGAVGIVGVVGWEKFRGGSRIEFVCGARALDTWRLWREALAQASRQLSVTVADLATAVDRLQADAKAQNRAARHLQEQLSEHQARSLLRAGCHVGGRIVVAEALEGWDAAGLKSVAASLTSAEPASAVALFTTPPPAMIVVARGRDVELDALSVLRDLTSRFGGRGGGKPALAQGGGLTGDVSDLLAEARRLLTPAG